MKKVKFLVLSLVAVFFLYSCDNAQKNSSTEVAEDANEEKFDDTNENLEEDSEFLVEAASGGMMEVELGNLASQKAASDDVKKFGAMMVTDHTNANNELKSLAQTKNVTLPQTLSNKHQRHVDDMKEKTGADFDKAYMDLMVDDHKEDVDKFEDAAESAKDADVKAFAAKTLPTLKSHRQEAERIQQVLKNQN